MRIFGDSAQFGIRYEPYENREGSTVPCCCHLILGNKLIGEKEESCYLPTWWSGLMQIREQIEDIINGPPEEIFTDYNDREIFELIFKSNHLEDEYKEEYRYLPEQSNNRLWVKHHVSIDETTDAYLIVMIKEEDKLKVIWQGWRNPCPENEIGKLNTVVLDSSIVLKTIDDVVEFLKTTFPRILTWNP